MAWVRIDDHFNEHPKLARVGPVGWGFWLAGLAYCNRNLTDGFIPRSVARSLGDFEVIDGDGELIRLAITSDTTGADLSAEWVIDLLLAARLWSRVSGGFRVHDFHDYQPSKDRVLSERAAKTERQSRWRERHVSNGPVDASTAASVDALVGPPGDGLVEGAPVPVPLNTFSSDASRSDRERKKASDDDRRLCRFLAEFLKKRNPKFKVKSDTAWLREMRRLRDIDGNAPEEIERLIRWLFTDRNRDAVFWAGQIQSPDNLRKHFVTLWGKMLTPSAGANVESVAAYLERRGAA